LLTVAAGRRKNNRLPNRRSTSDRIIALRDDLPPIPERLLLAHARGEVLFICGAGISLSANLPDFRQLVLDTYEALDSAVHAKISVLPRNGSAEWPEDWNDLTFSQQAEARRFAQGDYDVVLGMLERRIDNQLSAASIVRKEVSRRLRQHHRKTSAIHKVMMKLADRGGASSIVTTNFDLLLQSAAKRMRSSVPTYSLGSIPRPTRQASFHGIMHIHGALNTKETLYSDLVLSDQDFGEFYLRRRVIPDFIYDAARLFHLVLIGYSANDPPMRYLLNAVAADGSRFDDLKERFTFIGAETSDPVITEDWIARGITPISYEAPLGNHEKLLSVLERWSQLSAVNGKPSTIDKEVRRIVKSTRQEAPESDRDLFDHLIRRSSNRERERLASVASQAHADFGWLKAINGADNS